MHRSGTSAATGFLVHCGFRAPATLLPADSGNQEGYWESSVLCQFHERLLRAAGTRMDAFTKIDAAWFRSDAALTYREECRQILRAEFGAAPAFVVKDPRICRCLPFWLDVLEAEDVSAAAVLVLRDPTEVAASLGARDGFSRNLSILMWLRHVLEAEADSRSLRRSVLQYGDLLADWRRVQARLTSDLADVWPSAAEIDTDGIDRFLRRDLRHHDARQEFSDSSSVLRDWVARATAALTAISQGDPAHTDFAFSQLDAVRGEFDQAVDLFGCVDAEKQRLALEERVIRLEAEARALGADVQNLSASLSAMHVELTVLSKERADLQRENARIREAAADLTAERAVLQKHIGDLTAEREVLQKHAGNLLAEREAVLSSLSWRLTAPLRALAGALLKRN